MNSEELEKELSALELPEVAMNEHKNITKKAMTPLRNTPFLGVFIIVILGMIANEGVSNLQKFIDIPSLIIVTVIPLSLIVASYGIGGLKMIFKAPFEMNATGDLKNAYITVLKDMRVYAIISGWIGAIIGLILVFNDKKMLSQEYVELLPVFGLAMMTVLYGYMLAFLYAYPLQKRFEHNN